MDIEEKLLRIIAESENLIEIADKYIAYKYVCFFGEVLLAVSIMIGFGIGGYYFYKLMKDEDI